MNPTTSSGLSIGLTIPEGKRPCGVAFLGGLPVLIFPTEQMRAYVLLSKEEWHKLKGLGGSEWVKQALAAAPEPTTRTAYAVPPEERVAIANSIGPAKVIARQFRVSVDFVNYMRRKTNGPHSEAKRKKVIACPPPS